jgi:DNA-binding transcriptional ArsR family regulator
VKKAKLKLDKRKAQEMDSPSTSELSTAHWTFLSNHAHVVVCLSRDSNLRLRDLAQLVGITERGIHRVLSELEEAKIVEKFRDGRRNYYKVNYSAYLRHPLEHHATVGDLIGLLERE